MLVETHRCSLPALERSGAPKQHRTLVIGWCDFLLRQRLLKGRLPWTPDIVEDDLELLILLSPLPGGWDYKHLPGYLVYALLGMEPRASRSCAKQALFQMCITHSPWYMHLPHYNADYLKPFLKIYFACLCACIYLWAFTWHGMLVLSENNLS